MQYSFIVVGASAFASAVYAQGSNPLFFSTMPAQDQHLPAGKPVTLGFKAPSAAPVTITLLRGAPGNVYPLTVLSSTAAGGSYTWTPDAKLVSACDYGLQIDQAGQVKNYSTHFCVDGSGTSSSSSSASATVSTSAEVEVSTTVSGGITKTTHSTIYITSTLTSTSTSSLGASSTDTTCTTSSTGVVATDSGTSVPASYTASTIVAPDSTIVAPDSTTIAPASTVQPTSYGVQGPAAGSTLVSSAAGAGTPVATPISTPSPVAYTPGSSATSVLAGGVFAGCVAVVAAALLL